MDTHNPSGAVFDPAQYVKTFWTHGVSVLVTDVSRDMYSVLDGLFILHDEEYRQYFPKEKLEAALEEGVRFYGSAEFDAYEREITEHRENFKAWFAREILGGDLSKQAAARFLESVFKLCRLYSRMDFEYTDRAFGLRTEHPVIEKNLERVAALKDVVREFLNEVLFVEESYLKVFLGQLAAAAGIDRAKLEWYTQRDLLDLFEGKKIPPAELEHRKECFITWSEGGTEHFLVGADAAAVAKTFWHYESAGITEVSGQVANAPVDHIEGAVFRITVDYSDFQGMAKIIETMPHGSILLAETTAPELLQACKKASAIVTDIGGMLSHAAIVSRELGIPCIVGTERASRMFKTGDAVRLDLLTGNVARA